MKDRFVESWRRSGESNRSFGVSNPVAFGLQEQKNYMRNEAFRYIAKDRMIYGRRHSVIELILTKIYHTHKRTEKSLMCPQTVWL